MIRKCLCVTYFLRSQKGGIQAYLRYLKKELEKNNWEVDLLFLDDVIPVAVLRGRGWMAEIFRKFSPLQGIFDRQRIFATQSLLKKLAEALEKKIEIKKPDIVHVQDAYAGFAALPILQKNKIPLVVTNHGPIIREGEFGPLYRQFVESMEKTTYQNAKAIILVGKHLESYVLPKSSPRVPYFVIHNAIDIASFLAKSQKEYPGLVKNYILVVARLDPEKGVDIALKAFPKVIEKYPEFNLVIVGDGKLKKELKKLAAKLGIINRVHFLGWVLPNDVPSIYRKAKIIWITSKPLGNIQEPLPIVALESLASGKPIISSNTGGLAEVFCKGGGILIPSNNPELLSEATLKILNDDKLAKEVSQEAQKIAREYYGVNSWIQKVLEIYNSVLK